MTITKRTHFNPCFWTALWNKHYYHSFIHSKHSTLECRKQKFFSLNLKSNKIVDTKTDDVFFEKHTGIIKFSDKEIIDYCQKYFPDQVDNFNLQEYKDKLHLIDFENHFSIIEEMIKSVLKLANEKKIKDLQEKTELGLFIFTHLFRSPLHLNKYIDSFIESGGSKLEAFLLMKHSIIGNSENLMHNVIPIVSKEWTVYESKRYIPISDNPIIHHNDKLYITISPHLLIIVNKKQVMPDEICKYSTLSYFKYHSLLRLIIKSSYNEIVADDKKLLERIQKKGLFKRQLMRIKNKDHLYYE